MQDGCNKLIKKFLSSAKHDKPRPTSFIDIRQMALPTRVHDFFATASLSLAECSSVALARIIVDILQSSPLAVNVLTRNRLVYKVTNRQIDRHNQPKTTRRGDKT